MFKSNRGFAHLFLILVLVVAAIGAVGFRSYTSQHQQTKLADCGDTKQLLSQSPVKLQDLTTIIPLGNLAPPGHVLPTYHMYYNYVHSGEHPNKLPNRTELHVPADMIVTKIMLMDNKDLANPYNAYRVDFDLCKQVSGYFILIQELNDKLASAMQPPYDQTQESDTGTGIISRNFIKAVNVKLKAGEILGYAGGKKGYPDGLDFAIEDRRLPEPKMANPDRWHKSSRYFACTLDYYHPALSKQLYARLGDFEYKVNGAITSCGSIYQDEPGTSQGVWVTKETPKADAWEVNNILALAHDNYNQARQAFSFGNRAKDLRINTGRAYRFTTRQSGKVNRKFDQVKSDGSIYCYEADSEQGGPGSKITVLVQLTSPTALKIGLKSGSCGTGPWRFGRTLEYIR